MDPDPLTIIAESSRAIAQSTAAIAQSTASLDATQATLTQMQAALTQMQRLAFRLQAFVCVLLGASLLFLSLVVWQHLRSRHTLALVEQTLTLQIQALRDQLRPR
jgi:hypothetical protein